VKGDLLIARFCHAEGGERKQQTARLSLKKVKKGPPELRSQLEIETIRECEWFSRRDPIGAKNVMFEKGGGRKTVLMAVVESARGNLLCRYRGI